MNISFYLCNYIEIPGDTMDQDFFIRKMEKYADEKGIPIMEKEGINFLVEFVKLNNVKNILEIGSAIGYSSICMALASPSITVTTIERDKDRYIQALKNVKAMNLDSRITLVLADALEFNTEEKYDLIFIDAAKSQYIKFFEKFKKNLNPRGFIITDNINFHGLVMSDKSLMSRNLRQLITKLEKYITFLNTNEEFKTRFFEVGDGVAISRRKKSKDE